VRTVVYVDSVYREVDGAIYGEISFTLFIAALAREMDVTVVGRLDPEPGPARYRLPDEVRFVALDHYSSLAAPRAAVRSLVGSLRTFWSAMSDADVAWLFGPYLHAQLFALLALARRRRVVLGVRQDFPAYVRRRRPNTRWMHAAADLLEVSWRRLARRLSTVVVGPQLADDYGDARALLPIAVSLVTDADIEDGRRRPARDYEGELQVLSVGRLDQEKNPLLLADVLARLRRADPRWRMVICGDGPLENELRTRLRELGVDAHAELRGHVALRGGLLELYRDSHALLHVSFTEGFPQVLIEAFASSVPTVATAVGGVSAAAGSAALLIPPADAPAAASALARIAAEPELRARLVQEGIAIASRQTIDHEIQRVAAFLRV
jgi:glycosyltransferase involved in cell wall biosynthesis